MKFGTIVLWRDSGPGWCRSSSVVCMASWSPRRGAIHSG